MEKLNEEVAEDRQHLRRLIGICEGNLEIWCGLSCETYIGFSRAYSITMLFG